MNRHANKPRFRLHRIGGSALLGAFSDTSMTPWFSELCGAGVVSARPEVSVVPQEHCHRHVAPHRTDADEWVFGK